MSREAADVARRAAEIIQQRGKATGVLEDENTGAVCMWGAILIADGVKQIMNKESGLSARRAPHYPEIRDALALRFPESRIWPGWIFNDSDKTTAQDVAKTLLQLADEVEVQ